MTLISEQNRHTALTQHILDDIKYHHGALSFSSFMRHALYHPTLGFYNAPSFAIGEKGSFTTAPELSPLFAQCFATQIAPLMQQLPEQNLLELGAGSGRFAKDLLLALEAAAALPTHYYILEISPSLRAQQKMLLAQKCPHLLERIIWLEQLPDAFIGVMIANEVLDAIPFDCFEVQEGETRERVVVEKNGAFAWDVQKPLSTHLSFALPDGYRSEINTESALLVKQMGNALQQGVIFLADYGYGEREYYHPERRFGTLTCFYQHQKNDDPLSRVGLQDITAHVDFTRVAETAVSAGLSLLGFTTQASFLLANGFLEKAALYEIHLSEADRVNFHRAMKTLLLPTEMGDVIKIMGLGKGVDFSPTTFQLQDRRRDL